MLKRRQVKVQLHSVLLNTQAKWLSRVYFVIYFDTLELTEFFFDYFSSRCVFVVVVLCVCVCGCLLFLYIEIDG